MTDITLAFINVKGKLNSDLEKMIFKYSKALETFWERKKTAVSVIK